MYSNIVLKILIIFSGEEESRDKRDSIIRLLMNIDFS